MSNYRKRGEVKKGVKGKSGDVLPDIATSFTILLAIFFPSVTGMCSKVRSSYRRCSVKKGVLKNFAKFIGKHLCQSI